MVTYSQIKFAIKDRIERGEREIERERERERDSERQRENINTDPSVLSVTRDLYRFLFLTD